jgi:hypothetical protein
VQWGAVMHDVAKLVGTSSVNTLVCHRCYLPGLKPTFPKDWCTSACLPPRDTSDIVKFLGGVDINIAPCHLHVHTVA